MSDYKKLAEDALELMKVQSRKGNHLYPSVYAYQLARAVLALEEENQRLRAALENYVAYDHDWFGLSHDDLKQAREALKKPA